MSKRILTPEEYAKKTQHLTNEEEIQKAVLPLLEKNDLEGLRHVA